MKKTRKNRLTNKKTDGLDGDYDSYRLNEKYSNNTYRGKTLSEGKILKALEKVKNNPDLVEYLLTTDNALKSPKAFFEKEYLELAKEISTFSMEEILRNTISKRRLQSKMFIISNFLVTLEYVVLLFLLFFQGFSFNDFNLNETIITVYMTSIFVETLGIIYIIVRHLFSSKSEEKNIEVLTSIISNFQKYSDNEYKEKIIEAELLEMLLSDYYSKKKKSKRKKFKRKKINKKK